MQSTARSPRMISRLVATLAWATALVAAIAWPVAVAPGLGSGFAAASPPGRLVDLNAYCQDPGAVGQLSDGRTVYCTRVARTDAYVWSYSRQLMPRDPNTRGYTCDGIGCRFPDGSEVPNYQRCGILCGEPPTSGDVQSGLYDCFRSGAPFEECAGRRPR